MSAGFHGIAFGRWEVILVFWLPALVNLSISAYCRFAYPHRKTVNLFAIFAFLLGCWQLGEGMVRLSIASEDALKWYHISGNFVLFAIPFGILFIIHFANWEKKLPSRFVVPFLFIPTLVCFIFTELGLDTFAISPSPGWYWIVTPQPGVYTNIIYAWIFIEGLVIIVLLWRYLFMKGKTEVETKRALALGIGFTIPTLTGLVMEMILPLLFGTRDIPLSAPSLSAFSACCLFAISRYDLFRFTLKSHWRKVVSMMNQGVLITDTGDRIHYANETFCQMLGYDMKELRKLGLNDMVADVSDIALLKEVMKLRKKGISNQYEICVKAKSGERIWMLVSGAPYYDDHGKVIGTISIQTNINHLKLEEKRRIHNEVRFNQAQAIAHVGSWEIDFASGISKWSDEACRIYGIDVNKKNELSFEAWLSCIHPDDLDAVSREVQLSQLNSSDSSFIHRIVRKDGSVRYVHTVSKCEIDNKGKGIGLYGICHDITEQVESRNMLLETEQRMQSFIDESQLCVYFLDPATKKIIYANPAFHRLTGYTEEELAGMMVYDLIQHDRDNVDERIKMVMEMKSAGNSERQWRRKDGRIIHVMVSLSYKRMSGSDIIYAAAQDITELKLAEEKLEQSNRELQAFVYKASHDLKGPLESVMGLVNVSRMDVKDQAAAMYLDMIGTSTQKLNHILVELVKAMSIRNSPAANEVIPVEAMISDILSRFHHSPGFSRLDVKVRCALKADFIGNRYVVETILQNLVENAIKYQNTNRDSFLLIDVSESEGYVEIKVEDNGIGMDKAIREKVFDMYFRGTEISSGSGLGLYLVKIGVEKLKGQISLESESLKGARFTIRLPLAVPAA